MCPASNSSLGANVDEDDVVAAHPLEELLAVDALDLLAEVVAGGRVDLGKALGRGVLSASQSCRTSSPASS